MRTTSACKLSSGSLVGVSALVEQAVNLPADLHNAGLRQGGAEQALIVREPMGRRQPPRPGRLSSA